MFIWTICYWWGGPYRKLWQRGVHWFNVTKFGVCNKSEKVNFATSEKIGISGVTDKYRGNDTVSLRRETDSFAFNSIAFKNQQVSLSLSAVSWDHNYCRIFNNEIECPTRLVVSECQGSLRLETAAKHISEHNQIFWISNSESLSIQAVPSTSTICSMQARSNQHSSRCNVTVLELHVSIRFPPFQSDKSNSEKGPSRKGGANDNSCTNMSVRDVNVMPTVVDTTARSTARSSRK